jgi:ATP-binding cassette subfamily B protein
MGAMGYSAGLLCAVAGQRFALSLRCETYDKICDLSVLQVSRVGTGSLITRLTTDIDTCAEFVYALILMVIEPGLLMIGGVLMMWRISSKLGLVFVLFVIVQLLIMFMFIHMTSPGFVVMRQKIDEMNGRLQSAFSRFRLIKAYGTEKKENSWISETNKRVYEASYAVQMKLAVFNPLIMLVMDLAVACVLYISGWQVSKGTMHIGLVLSAITYVEQVLLSITVGGRMFHIIAETIPSAGRIIEVMDLDPAMKDGEETLESNFQSLKMHHVCFSYKEGVQVFHSLDFEINAGEMVAVIGTVGCGKTTLTGLSARLFDVDKGQILLNGVDIRSFSIDDVHRMIALVEKNTAVLEGTIWDNIIFGRKDIDDSDVLRALLVAQMEEYLDNHPEGKDTFLMSMGKNISAGEKQRLVIARALAANPGLLVLDDSTCSLDYKTEKNLYKAIKDNYPHIAILFTTNRLPSALQADRIVILEDGKVADVGTDEELRERCELYRRICKAQDMM